MTARFATAPPPRLLFRVGRAPDVWEWPDWAYAAPDGTFGCRWDDPDGRYRVLYASSQRLGCFLEALAALRPDPFVVSALRDIVETDEDEPASATPGVVPRSWCDSRSVATGVPDNIDGVFVVVGASLTLATLRSALASRLVHHLVTDLDAATVRASTPRALTQEISSYVAVHRDEQGRPYAGIRYQSKLGDEIVN